jgi:hypothetical protein
MQKYIMSSNYLPDGKYLTSSCKKWHESLRMKLAYWLFASVKKDHIHEVKTYTGVI